MTSRDCQDSGKDCDTEVTENKPEITEDFNGQKYSPIDMKNFGSLANRVGREPYGSPPPTPPYVPVGIRRFMRSKKEADAP